MRQQLLFLLIYTDKALSKLLEQQRHPLQWAEKYKLVTIFIHFKQKCVYELMNKTIIVLQYSYINLTKQTKQT